MFPLIATLLLATASTQAARLADQARIQPVLERELNEARGAVQPRPHGGWAQLVVHDAHFELWLFDRHARRVPVRFDHAVAVYRSPAHGRNHDILNPTADRLALRSNNVIDGPYAYHVHVDLFRAGDTKPIETFEFDYRRGVDAT